MSLGILTFLSPLPLLGLLSLPVIWWLLRSTPPSPDRQVFPPTRILKRLLQNEKTASHSPWWLTLLRLIISAFIIFALAQPVLNSAKPLLAEKSNTSDPQTEKQGPLVIVVDNGWTAASKWSLRKIMMERLVRDAQAQERLVFLVPTAPERNQGELTPFSALDALSQIERMQPTPFHTDRNAALEKLSAGLDVFASGRAGALENSALYWLADGIEAQQSDATIAKLNELKSSGFSLHLISPDDSSLPLALSARLGQGGVLYGIVKGAPLNSERHSERRGQVLALSGREEVLGRAAFILKPNQTSVEARIDLPLELRNQITKLKIEGQSSAGSVYLLDQRSNWRRIGLLSNESGELAQPLLSPLYYIKRALEPYAELVSAEAGTGNVAETIDSFTKQNVSVIMMADIGRLVGAPLLRLTEWVEKGGVLVRFAGPHMEESQDSLLPSPLRQGGRRLGGALSWSKPQSLANFDEQSPFAGLAIPGEVVVSRQLLADPSRLSDKVYIWARLKDGTPLVTATRELDGWVVLVHVTANSDWSNLPLSGLFVEMLQRLSQLSLGGQASSNEESSSSSERQESATQEQNGGENFVRQPKETLLAPYRSLNGLGRLEKPPVFVEPVAFSQLNKLKIEPKHPPGFYGPADQTIALNLMKQTTELKKLNYASLEAEVLAYRKAPERDLRGPLFITAFILLVLDSLIVLFMRGVFSLRHLRETAAIILALLTPALIVLSIPSKEVLAQSIERTPSGEQLRKLFEEKRFVPSLNNSRRNNKDLSKLRSEAELNLSAALKTHLAYVITGDSKIDQTSRDGLRGLSFILNNRTAVEPAEPIGVRPEKDELAFYPILYWPVGSYSKPLSDKVAQRINSYMKHGGMIIFDTKDQDSRIGGLDGRSQSSLKMLLSKLDIPRIEPVPTGHVLTKSFYLLSSFPGRFQGGDLWVEAAAKSSTSSTSDIDGVSTLLITSNDLASAWAVDKNYQERFPVVPGGESQREMAYRVGVNIVMYALAGNYKADQVHVPALLERLGQ
ncbi:MAG: DUF4159 domain-containing protein [Rhizobiales bacterium]|nr:DUF4159 domain-containing protein [Hyphomicrobiales bacterium]